MARVWPPQFLINLLTMVTGVLALANGGTGTTPTLAIKTLTVADTPYTQLSTDRVLLCDTSGGNIAITGLAAGGWKGVTLLVEKVTADAGTVTFTPQSGTVDGAATVVLSNPYGKAALTCSGANVWLGRQPRTFSLFQTPPTFSGGVTPLVTVTSDRIVFGTASVTPSVANLAYVQAKIETGIATGVYTEVQLALYPAGVAVNFDGNFSFVVPAGRRYQFLLSGNAGVTETMRNLNHVDLY